MKTNQITERKTQQKQEIQKDRTDFNQHLENNEKILYLESLKTTEDSLVGIATTLFLICGFPFYLVIGFTALTAYLSERSLREFGQEVIWPAAILLAVAVISLVLGLACKAFYTATQGANGTKFLVTGK